MNWIRLSLKRQSWASFKPTHSEPQGWLFSICPPQPSLLWHLPLLLLLCASGGWSMDHSIRAPLPAGLSARLWTMEAGDEGQEAREAGIFCPCSLSSPHCLLATLLCGPSTCQAALPCQPQLYWAPTTPFFFFFSFMGGNEVISSCWSLKLQHSWLVHLPYK